jgi:predicted transcriptional regulator
LDLLTQRKSFSRPGSFAKFAGIVKRRKLTQAKAADMLGLKQPDVSALVTGRVGKFSIGRLVRCLDRLDYKVDLVVRHKPRRAASRAIAA